MSRHSLFGAAALIGALAVVPAYGQTTVVQDEHDKDRPVGKPMLFVSGGGNNSLRNLTDVNNDTFDIGSDFETGYNVTAGIGVQLNRWAALRGVYTFSRAQGEGTAFSPIAGHHFNRHYYGADLQLRAGSDGSFAPYLFVGGGAVTVSPASNAVLLSPTGAQFSNSSFTKPAGRAGIGFEYQFPNSGFGLYAEGSAWVYNWDRYGFDRTQVDTNWGAGLTYRFGY
jgi:hypothetical protein